MKTGWKVIQIFRVAIIDDEALVRVGLKSLINWEEQECEIIGEASNGEAGYELIVNSIPDIVITDIKMPVMDGLEMIDKLIKQNIKAKFIVLSSYDEFELVRKAMKLGIEEYIIKLELESEPLIKILTRIKEKLLIDSEIVEKEKRFKKHIRANSYAIREEFFKKLIGKIITERKEIIEELEYLQLNLNEKGLVCALIKISEINNMKKYREEDVNLLEFSILNIVDEIVKDMFIGYTFKWTIDEYMVIFSNDSNLDENISKEKIRDMCQRVYTMLKQYFNISVEIAVSKTKKDFMQISEAYAECSQTIKQSFYFENDKIVFFDDINLIKVESNGFDFAEITDEILKYIELNDIEAISITFDNIIDSLNKEKVSKEMAYDVCARMAYIISIGLEKNERSLQQVFGNDNTIFETILKLRSLQDVIDWLRKIEKGICIVLSSNENTQNNKIISKAKRYVSENIGSIIGLQDIASTLNISSGYFSTIFKQETGMNFIDYVTEVRINEAKRLLKEGNHKIYEIAQMTGYENAYYFSKVFKKVTGITPREFISR